MLTTHGLHGRTSVRCQTIFQYEANLLQASGGVEVYWDDLKKHSLFTITRLITDFFGLEENLGANTWSVLELSGYFLRISLTTII